MPAAKKTPSKSKAKKPVAATTKAAKAEDSDGVRSSSLGLEIDQEVLEFIEALDRFKEEHHRQFPNWSEVLFVLKQLGYRRA